MCVWGAEPCVSQDGALDEEVSPTPCGDGKFCVLSSARVHRFGGEKWAGTRKLL